MPFARLYLFRLLVFLFPPAVVVCFASADGDLALPNIRFNGSSATLRQWMICGPFVEKDQTNNPWKTDFFASLGTKEAGLTPADFQKYAYQIHEAPNSRGPLMLDMGKSEFVDFQSLLGRERVKGLAPTALYLGCTIECSEERSGFLLVASSDGPTVWINGQMVLSVPASRGVLKYSDAVKLKLAAGRNFLMLKVPRIGINWALTAKIEPTAEIAAATALEARETSNGLLLSTSVIRLGDTLRLAPRGVPQGARLFVDVIQPDGEIVAAKAISSGVDDFNLPNNIRQGVYIARIKAVDTVCEEPFIYGDFEVLGKTLFGNALRLGVTDQAKINLEALQRRWTTLCKPESQVFKGDGQRRDWERKVVFTYQELEDIVDRLRANTEAFRNVSGIHVRGFRSKIDDQPQYYRIFIPKGYSSSTPLPLIVMMPTVTSANRAFIDSVFMASHNDAERFASIGEKYNVGILWSGYRNQPSGLPCEVTHLEEAIDAVSADYNIDQQRISVVGACSGGAMAIISAAQRPHRFAGIGLLNTVLGLSRNVSPAVVSEFSEFPSFAAWTRQDDLVDKLLVGGGPPIYMIHDGAEPGHGDLLTSKKLAALAFKRNYPLRFQEDVQTVSQHFGAWEQLVAWLAVQKSPRFEKDADRSSVVRIADIFAGRFVVVKGTGGSTKDREQIDAIANGFQTAWEKTYYGTCRIVIDKEYIDVQEKDSNLVLIGTNLTNSVWGRIGPTLPMKEYPFGLSVNEHRWSGGGLTYQIVVPKPDNPRRGILLVGLGEPSVGKAHAVALAGDGWFSYALWRNETHVSRIVDAGVW